MGECVENPILHVSNLKKRFCSERGYFLSRSKFSIWAVDGVSFYIHPSETLGIVGESGSGKTTVARLVLRLIEPDDGEIFFMGRNIFKISQREMRALRKNMQIIFQDPLSSLNPRMSIFDSVAEPLYVHKVEGDVKSKVFSALHEVGLDSSLAFRFPHQLSGGQRQRVLIARALLLNPSLIVADEPTSALDVSVQAQVLNLFLNLQKKRRFASLFISHNLAVVKYVSNRIAVMYKGRIVEMAERSVLFKNPCHPYTIGLIKAFPDVKTKKVPSAILQEQFPPPVGGCSFYPRCAFRREKCKKNPSLLEVEKGHFVSCFYPQGKL